jgi:hypothetical protein
MINEIISDEIQADIDALEAGLADPNCTCVDCLLNELQGTINSFAINGDISDELADYLWRVYITGDIKKEEK